MDGSMTIAVISATAAIGSAVVAGVAVSYARINARAAEASATAAKASAEAAVGGLVDSRQATLHVELLSKRGSTQKYLVRNTGRHAASGYRTRSVKIDGSQHPVSHADQAALIESGGTVELAVPLDGGHARKQRFSEFLIEAEWADGNSTEHKGWLETVANRRPREQP